MAIAEAQSSTVSTEVQDNIDYAPLIKAARNSDWSSMEQFLDCHPQAVTSTVFPFGRTLLHYLLQYGKNESRVFLLLLVNRMRANDMEILDQDGFTPLAVAANILSLSSLPVLEFMVSKNPNLPNIGSPTRLPVTVAAWGGFKEKTRFLYSVTDKRILDPECGIKGVSLLVNCINGKIFDIASDLIHQFPKILHQKNASGIYPIHALSKTFNIFQSDIGHKKRSSGLKHWWSNFEDYIVKYVHHLIGDDKIPKMSKGEELMYDQACAFLELVCSHVSTFDIDTLVNSAYGGMVEATIRGNYEFVYGMLSANPYLIWAHKDGSIFIHAVKYRRVKIFNFVYGDADQRDRIFSWSNPERNNILHFAAMLPPSHVLDRTSGSALQVQRELQWFKELWNLVNPKLREELNIDNLTPAELFTKSHEKLIDDGEKSMKDTAQSSTVVGALIVTIMFAVAFTIPGGNNQETGYPLFVREGLFKVFILCDALSLYSSATSVLVFLGILTSSYDEDDFLLILPRKLILGVSTLFFSIATMMITFCAALAIMLNERLQLILPIVLLAFVPVILFLTSIFPLLSKIYLSTFGPSIFDKNTKLPEKKEYKKIADNPSRVTETPSKKEGENTTNDSSNVDQVV